MTTAIARARANRALAAYSVLIVLAGALSIAAAVDQGEGVPRAVIVLVVWTLLVRAVWDGSRTAWQVLIGLTVLGIGLGLLAGDYVLAAIHIAGLVLLLSPSVDPGPRGADVAAPEARAASGGGTA